MHALFSTPFINIFTAIAAGALLVAHVGRAHAGTRVPISEQKFRS